MRHTYLDDEVIQIFSPVADANNNRKCLFASNGGNGDNIFEASVSDSSNLYWNSGNPPYLNANFKPEYNLRGLNGNNDSSNAIGKCVFSEKRCRSMAVAKTMSDRRQITPAIVSFTCSRSSTGLPRMASAVRNSMCPPSRAGIGRKLSTARLALSMVRNNSSEGNPCEAMEPATPIIPSGPERFVAEIGFETEIGQQFFRARDRVGAVAGHGAGDEVACKFCFVELNRKRRHT